MAWQDWKEKGQDWKTIYAGVEPAVQEVAAAHMATVTLWRWDEPSIALTWMWAGLKRKVRILIEGSARRYALSLSGAVWQDAPGPREYTQLDDLGQLFVGPSEAAPALRDKFQNTLKDAMERLQSVDRAKGKASLPRRSSIG